jgi:hypothetical protein
MARAYDGGYHDLLSDRIRRSSSRTSGVGLKRERRSKVIKKASRGGTP